MTVHDLTPVQEIAGMYFKRDDLFTPFGAGEVNGGKLRQCMMLVEAALRRKPDMTGVITYCSIHSPARPDNGGHGKAFPPTVRRCIRGGPVRCRSPPGVCRGSQ